MLFTLEPWISFSAQRPALPAAGEKKAAKRKPAIVQNQLKKRAESQPSGARFVGRHLIIGNPSYSNSESLIPTNHVFWVLTAMESVEPITIICPKGFMIIRSNVAYRSPPKVFIHCMFPT
jgi:hypothetical protein